MAVLLYLGNPGTRLTLRALDVDGGALGIEALHLEIRNAADFDSGPSPFHAIGRAPVYLTSLRSATAADPSNTVPGDCRSGDPRFLAIVNIWSKYCVVVPNPTLTADGGGM